MILGFITKGVTLLYLINFNAFFSIILIIFITQIISSKQTIFYHTFQIFETGGGIIIGFCHKINLSNYETIYSIRLKLFKLQNFNMKAVSCRNIERFVANHNKQLQKTQESCSIRSELKLQSILGISSQEIGGSVIFALSNQEVIYYSSQYFVVHNLLTKESSIIRKQGCFSHKTIHIDKFQTEAKTDLIFTIQKSQTYLYIGQLQITGNITETNGTKSTCEMKNFNWKLSKLSNKHNYNIQTLTYHAAKRYIYILTSRQKQEKLEKSLWVYDLKRECLIVSTQIKPSVSKVQISSIWATDDPSEIYLMGKNYFRFWTINFNEKNLKQSNYRNIERSLSGKKIVKIFYCQTNEGKMLSVLTDTNIMLLKRNQLVSCQQVPINSIKKSKNKANIEVQLENSLNQIYRMKFMLEDEENQTKPNEDFQLTPENIQQENNRFSCASQIWNSQGVDCIVISTRIGNLLTYSITNGQLKLLNQLIVKKNHSFQLITASKKGEVIILAQKNCQNLYIINKYTLNSEESEQQLKQFWGAGHINKQNIFSIDSPAVHQRICSLGQNGTIRMWSFKGKERKILFEEKLMNQPTHIAMHPCGLLVAVNYPKQIKLMSVLPTGLYEVMSAKTNYNSVGLRYSECGNFLISNQENLIMFYNPFNLKALGYLQPPQLKSTIVDFQTTPQGSHIAYLTSDYGFYIQPLDLSIYNKFQNIQPAHVQRELYTCFYFQNNIMRQPKGSQIAEKQDLLIACSKNKYMILYKNLGKTLISQFPVEDCYITALCVADGWLFASTSKKSIRVYKWPLFEEDCEMQLLSIEQKIVKFKPPTFQEHFLWGDNKRIIKLHKLGFTNRLLIVRQGGIMNILTYKRLINDKTDDPQRKKMMIIVNDSFFITKNESDKRNRLIQKTQGDILKVQNEISKEKSIMQRRYRQQCQQIQKTFLQKHDIHTQEKSEYQKKMKNDIQNIKNLIITRQNQFTKNSERVLKIYESKQNYESFRNMQIEKKTAQTITSHKQKLINKMESHKQDIRSMKYNYKNKIAEMRKQFQSMISNQYPHLMTKKDINAHSTLKKSKSLNRTSIKYQQIQDDGFLEQFNNEQLNTLTNKVEEIKKNNQILQHQLLQVKRKVKNAEHQDENIQKEFQKCLQQYNNNRFTNLSLHSQVLKMRTQLIQRKQIMQNKQQIINMAFQERQKLQNYKQLVRGSLTKLQDKKEDTYHAFIHKQNQLSLIFQQFTTNVTQLEAIKRQESRTNALIKVIEKEKTQNTSCVDEKLRRLNQLKRYLLLEGLTQDAQQKKLYLQQENLLTNINFYKKRMSMEFMKEKKNKILKKSALNLVLKQNKNLLEQCNQLRQQTIQYSHQIKNLGRKLGQAKKIISIQTKLKDQKSQIVEQRNQLNAIRALFNDQTAIYEEDTIDRL